VHAIIDDPAESTDVLVLLHGRGSHEHDLLPTGRMLHPGAALVAVRAPFPAAPWGYGEGFAWYRYLGGTTPEAGGFAESQRQLEAFVAAIPGQLGRPVSRMIIAGFSQGGTSALALALRRRDLVTGALVLSGFLADHPDVRPDSPSTVGLPVFWGHGTADPAVPIEAAEAGWARLSASGVLLEAHRYEGMGHGLSRAELSDAARWLGELGLDPTGA
jgi:phospholipase/carboxylesterase